MNAPLNRGSWNWRCCDAELDPHACSIKIVGLLGSSGLVLGAEERDVE